MNPKKKGNEDKKFVRAVMIKRQRGWSISRIADELESTPVTIKKILDVKEKSITDVVLDDTEMA